MATMNISLPDKMREWIDQQVATGRFSNASDLVRDLIRDAQMREMVNRGLDMRTDPKSKA